jgi:hypothetical protein
MGGNVLAFEPHQREGVGGIVDLSGDDGVDALADQAGILAKDEHDRRRPVETSEIRVDARAFDRNHGGGVQVPATKYEASLFLILSATTCVARSSASRCPRCLANRCWPLPGMS